MSATPGRFVIMSVMRTGSNLLQQMLNAIDGVVCHGELMNHSAEAVHPPFRHLVEGERAVVKPSLRVDDPAAYLEAIIGHTQADHVGFRIFPEHHNPTLKALVEDPSWHKIILTRNVLESYVSLLIANQNNQWIMNHKGTRKPWSPVQIDPREFKHYALRTSAYYYHIISRCHVTGQSVTPVSYDRVNAPETLERLVNLFGGSRSYKAEAVTALKQNPEPLQEKIKNYDEIEKMLKRLKLADWLTD